MESEVQKLNMQDPEDANAQLRRGGAKTRDGQDSVCVAFLPADFNPLPGSERKQAEQVLMESCNLCLTHGAYNDIIMHEDRKSKVRMNIYLRHCIQLRPQSDGSYYLGNQRYLVDDEIGIMKG